MPLKWKKGCNPYVHNYFNFLGAGPRATPAQIVQFANNRNTAITHGQPIEIGGVTLDKHAVSDASKELRQPRSLAEELLLVHPPGEQQQAAANSPIERIRQAATWPIDRTAPELSHPLALFWFLPAPTLEVVPRPEWSQLRLVAPGDPQDTCFDIVFDS
jgi:hypothetical protein